LQHQHPAAEILTNARKKLGYLKKLLSVLLSNNSSWNFHPDMATALPKRHLVAVYPLKIPCIFFQIVLCACDKAMGREQIHSTSLQILGKWSCLLEPYFYALTVLTDSEHATISVSAQNNRKSHRTFWHVPELPDGQSGPVA